MADTILTPNPAPEAAKASSGQPSLPKVNRAAALNKLYALPAPVRTFPFPTLVPHNVLSLFHILYVWLSQTITPPSSTLEVPYQGWWSPETRSVHVTDSRSIRGLWEQGFYGKGSLSRSEPNWLVGQNAKRSVKGKSTTSEDHTKKRRAERQQLKWERARKEREAIEQRLLEEAEAALIAEIEPTVDSTSTEEDSLVDSDTSATLSDTLEEIKEKKFFQSPVGPLELLSMPNSSFDLERHQADIRQPSSVVLESVSDLSSQLTPVETLPLTVLHSTERVPLDDYEETPGAERHSLKPEDEVALASSGTLSNASPHLNDRSNVTYSSPSSPPSIADDAVSGSVKSDDTAPTSNSTPDGSDIANGFTKTKSQKSVRFSPTVERNTFISNAPPSPEHASLVSTILEAEEEPLEEIMEQEHFQLTLEEAFFLSYGLGALTILDPATQSPIPNQDLFGLFRRSSYFPPLSNPSLSPDDPFMLNYVVYHHFRSLGWVVRGGVKFAVDLMLYTRGPVFTHAEFGVIILPSYTDPYWSSDAFLQNYVKGKEKRTWAWFHCINRVITQARKTLVLVYVDVPKPLDERAEKEMSIDGVLGRYHVREVVMQRWSSNRQRD